jgi:hypothetical protein
MIVLLSAGISIYSCQSSFWVRPAKNIPRQIAHEDSLTKFYASKGKFNHLCDMYFLEKYQLLVASDWNVLEFKWGAIDFWSLDSGKLNRVITLRGGDQVYRMIASHDQELLFVAVENEFFDDNYVACFSVRTMQWIWKDTSLEEGYGSAFTKDDQEIVFVGKHHIYYLNSVNGSVIRKISSAIHTSWWWPRYFSHLVLLNNEGTLLMEWTEPMYGGEHGLGEGAYEKTKGLEVYDLSDPDHPLFQTDKPGIGIGSALFSVDNDSIMLAGLNGSLYEWSLRDNMVRKRATICDGAIDYLFSSRKRHLSGIYSNNAIIFDDSSFQQIKQFDKISEGWTAFSRAPLVFSSDGLYFALEQRGVVCLYDTKTWKEIWHFNTLPH